MPATRSNPRSSKGKGAAKDARPSSAVHKTAAVQALKPCAPMLRIPDMITASDFDLRMNPHLKHGSTASESWIFRGGNLSDKKRKAYHGLKAGVLTAMCYPEAPQARFRILCDYINYLFHLDNLSDAMDKNGTVRTADVVLGVMRDPFGYQNATRVGRMTRDWWKRVIKTAPLTVQQRFIHAMAGFFTAIGVEAVHRRGGVMYDMEDYVELRRDTSGCRTCFALVEYGYGLDIPHSIMENEVLQSLGDAASDVISWSNDIYSLNVEQAKGDTHNMVIIVMHERGLSMQDAIDYVAQLTIDTVAKFREDQRRIPSFRGHPECRSPVRLNIDDQVRKYVQGLEDWMAGNFHWSFESERYFGNNGKDVKRTGLVPLLPRRT